MKKTFSNFLYQSIFQITKILLPLITIPIVSNALGPEGIGIYNYTNSIVQYFVLFAGLGIGVYGNREIAINRDNKESLSKSFWGIFTMSFITSSTSLIVYLVFVSFLENSFFYYLQSLIIIAAVFDISWFFMGIEDFKKTSISSLLSQLISFVLIILFVHDESDLGFYIFVQSVNILFSQLIMWTFIRKYIIFVRVTYQDFKKHFIPALQFFIPKVAIVLYTNLNKTLLGWLDTKEAVGYFSNTLIMNSILVTFITTLDLVLLPKMSNLVANGRAKEIINFMKKTIHLQLFISIPMMFGVLTIVPKFVPWFFGDKFLFLIKTIPLVTPLVIIIPLGMAVGRQYLVPMNRMKIYNVTVLNGAAISIVTNIIFIPIIGVYGAIIAIFLAELFVSVTRFSAFMKETSFSFNYVEIVEYLLISITMYLLTTSITEEMEPVIITTIIQIVSGGAFYMISTSILKINPLINIIKNKSF